MLVEQVRYVAGKKERIVEAGIAAKAQLLLVFGSKGLICDKAVFDDMRLTYPAAYIMGCTTAGEISASQVDDNTLTATAVYFEKTPVKFATAALSLGYNPDEVARQLAGQIAGNGLKHVFLLSEGINVNGSKLVASLRETLPAGVTLTGGLSADGADFHETYVIANNYARKNVVVLAAFFGDNIKVGYGSVGGWDSFGIERVVTKASDNVVYELDGKPILDIYKEYLGPYSEQLPFSGLLFPLGIRSQDDQNKLVRTILGVDENDKSLTFAGDVPQGYYAKLMKSNSSSLINGALAAAEASVNVLGSYQPIWAVLISCVGRKLVLKQMIDVEVEITREMLGKETVYTGFYSYGEICPAHKDAISELHNQTMTITVFAED